MLKLFFERLAGSIRDMLRFIGVGRRITRREIFRSGGVGEEPSADYQRALMVLDNVARECITVSRQYGGLQAVTQKHFYASVLFTAMLSRSISLLMLAPYSPWASKMIEHWDYASTAVILRTMMELRAAFHYLCVDECTNEEWDCRWSLLNLHDCNSRIRLFEAQAPVAADQVAGLRAQAEEIRDRLKANPHFQTLRHQTRLLNGQTAYLFAIEEMMERAGLDKPTYRLLNVLFSSHVHGLPMSYYRMGMQERGRGLPSPIEEGYTTLCLSLASALLTATRDEVHELFKGSPPMQAQAPDASE
ncbi:DUF5677 domain-containing protein [Bradyrhizobium brasilense]|uniref:DUF5677 domain-containing protein n=1 Tax=Bradyrhizobium brasilense TaxID=1419277 RepID=A0ABY8JAV1_9BRAD|nr:DUF5677 domain-containing protein [Bradyrhizobium brasilense]WFU62694.1 DUF5677 domain-containing protein [Bradyrhizobium brasilense]